MTERLAKGGRNIRRRIHATRNAHLDLSQRNLVANDDRRLQRCCARLLHVVSGRLRGQTARQGRLTTDVGVACMFQDRAGHNFAECLPLQAEAIDHAPERGGEHIDITGVGVVGVLPRERDAHAAEDRDPMDAFHLITPYLDSGFS